MTGVRGASPAGRVQTMVRRREQGEGGQLALLETEQPVWRLDAQTREVGRRGVAAAREVLKRSASHDDRDANRAA